MRGLHLHRGSPIGYNQACWGSSPALVSLVLSLLFLVLFPWGMYALMGTARVQGLAIWGIAESPAFWS